MVTNLAPMQEYLDFAAPDGTLATLGDIGAEREFYSGIRKQPSQSSESGGNGQKSPGAEDSGHAGQNGRNCLNGQKRSPEKKSMQRKVLREDELRRMQVRTCSHLHEFQHHIRSSSSVEHRMLVLQRSLVYPSNSNSLPLAGPYCTGP